MARLLSLLLALVQLVHTILNFLREQKLREEGKEEERRAQEQAHEEAQAAARRIDEMVHDADLELLRERMREYQRAAEDR